MNSDQSRSRGSVEQVAYTGHGAWCPQQLALENVLDHLGCLEKSEAQVFLVKWVSMGGRRVYNVQDPP